MMKLLFEKSDVVLHAIGYNKSSMFQRKVDGLTLEQSTKIIEVVNEERKEELISYKKEDGPSTEMISAVKDGE